MSVVSMKSLLVEAEKKDYALGMFNFFNLEVLEAIIDAAEAQRSPVILGMVVPLMHRARIRELAGLARALAQESSVPIAIHIDHGRDIDMLIAAMDMGVTSVMYDGSRLSFDENVYNTIKVVKAASALGISTEAELGYIGYDEGKSTEHPIDPSHYTSVEQAVLFTEKTRVQALAIAVGNAHGIYRSKPVLDFDRISEIKKSTSAHLVLHGASGICDEDVKTAILLGIRKVNFFTEQSLAFSRSFADAIRRSDEVHPYHQYIADIRNRIQTTVEAKLVLLGSSGRADA